jgi:glycosyltransferase involved in cell wall biosynthesis
MEDQDKEIEFSIVMPCLNEADTLAMCIEKAMTSLRKHSITGEVIIADNGSTDGSPSIARGMGARVVHVETKGYGSALMGGIGAARGKYIIMGDADDSYDFLEIGRFVTELRKGFDLVMGCRFPSGGGNITPGAMPFLHRWWGNPMFSLMARWWFHVPTHDIHCGMRGFTRELCDRLDLRCTGMEFASEMVVKSRLYNMAITEVPLTLRPDGRGSHPPHLKTFRDGWRHLRFFLMYSPRWLFLIPGMLLIALGIIGYGLAMPRITLSGMTFDVHTLLFSSLGIICGYQSILFAVFTKAFAVSVGLLPEDPRITRFFNLVNLERALVAGAASMIVGLGFLGIAVNHWRMRNFGELDCSDTMRWVIPGVTLTTLGFQTILSGFFVSILAMRRR